MERRKITQSKSSPLPSDYLEMIKEVFTAHFDASLKVFQKIKPNSGFVVGGEIYSDEVLVSVSLVTEGQLAATTVYASTDFDPKASAPTAQDLLSACVDAAGSVLEIYLNAEKPDAIRQLAEQESLSSFENVPFEWTALESSPRVWVRLDTANPQMDALADDWLNKNDPTRRSVEEEEQKETEKLFFTGPRKKAPSED